MAGHAQLKFVMTECSKTQIRLTGLILRIPITFPFRLLWEKINTKMHCKSRFFFKVIESLSIFTLNDYQKFSGFLFL